MPLQNSYRQMSSTKAESREESLDLSNGKSPIPGLLMNQQELEKRFEGVSTFGLTRLFKPTANKKRQFLREFELYRVARDAVQLISALSFD